MSWVLKLQDTDRPRWLERFSQAYSRLRGTTCDVEIEENRFLIKESEKPHRAVVMDKGTRRVLDYSDPDFVKEFALY